MDHAEDTRHSSQESPRAVTGARASLPWLTGFMTVMLLSLCARAAVGIAAGPMTTGDTAGYMQFARLIWRGAIAPSQGVRTPGYPAFLVLHAFNTHAVIVTQFALGLAITAGLFFVLWRLTHSPWLASIGAALYGLSVGHISYESVVDPELLATFLLVTALVLMVSLRTRDDHARLKLAALGVAAGVLPLVRPLYVYVPLLLMLAVIGLVKRRPRRFWLYALPALIPCALWGGYLYSTFEYLGLQTASGFGWTNHAGQFMRDAPERYATIRDTYLRHVEEQQGEWVNAIWDAVPDMQRATGMSYPELSKTVQELSLGLLLTHPYGYSKQMLSGFIGFWQGASFPSGWRSLGVFARLVWMLSRVVGILVSAWFCGMVVCLVAVRLRLFRLPALPWPSLWLIAAVLVAAVVQAVVEYGGAPRFGMPTFPFAIVVALCGLDAWVLRRSTTQRRSEERPIV